MILPRILISHHFPFPKAKAGSINILPWVKSGEFEMSLPWSDNRVLWFSLIVNLIYVEQASSTWSVVVFCSVFKRGCAVSLFPCAPKRCIRDTFKHWKHLPPIPCNSSPFTEHFTVPINTHTQVQHDPATSSLSSVPKVAVTDRCCSRIVFLPFLSPTFPHQGFFSSSSLGTKCSNDVLLQNSISQFS